MPSLQLDDLTLFYQDSGSSAEILLALHPSTASGQLLQWALPKNDRFRILLPDQRGHGKTPNPAPDFHVFRFINDMWNLLDALEIDYIHGLGYSMGAGVLMGMASRQPSRFKSLTLIGSTHRRPNAQQITELAGPVEKRRGVARDVMDSERGLWAKETLKLAALSNIDCPIHLITGDRDPVAEPSAAVELHQALSNSELFIVPNCGHFGYHTSPLVKAYLQQIYEK